MMLEEKNVASAFVDVTAFSTKQSFFSPEKHFFDDVMAKDSFLYLKSASSAARNISEIVARHRPHSLREPDSVETR